MSRSSRENLLTFTAMKRSQRSKLAMLRDRSPLLKIAEDICSEMLASNVAHSLGMHLEWWHMLCTCVQKDGYFIAPRVCRRACIWSDSQSADAQFVLKVPQPRGECSDSKRHPFSVWLHIWNHHLEFVHLFFYPGVPFRPNGSSVGLYLFLAYFGLRGCHKSSCIRNHWTCSDFCSFRSGIGWALGRTAVTLLVGMPWHVTTDLYLSSGHDPDFHSTFSFSTVAAAATRMFYIVRTVNTWRGG